MRLREPAEDGACGGSPTVPASSAGGHWEWVQEEPRPGWDWRRTAGYPPRRRRTFRGLRRLAAVVLGFCLLGALLLGALLLITPPVGNAPALARAIDRQHRAAYPGPPVPARFAAALTATEDHRFYTEPGIDPFGVARVAFDAVTRRPDQGGATLYQQLAKMLYTPGGSGILSKAEEVALGIKLNFSYPKAQILQMYADVAYFGHGYYGLRSASCGYFGLPPAALSWPQAAMLAGIVQAPSLDDPFTHYVSARAREAHVLARLAAVGRLTPAQARTYGAQPLRLVPGGGHCPR
jgi:hypothetical protein